MATHISPLSLQAGPPGKAGPWTLEVALFEPRPEVARVLLDGLLRKLVAAHFTDLEALAQCCREFQPAAVALPLSLVSAGPELEQAVLAFLRAFGRRAAIVVYADTARLSVAEYSRPLAAGARRLLNEAAPTFAEDLCDLLAQFAENERLRREEEQQLCDLMARHGLVGSSPAMREVFRRVLKAAHFSDLPVLLLGETGTGKQRLAEAIHALDPKRRDKPFLTVNCSAISKTLAESELFGHNRGAFSGAGSDRPGLFRSAEGGTLLLDEVGELDPELQPKLLRVLQERRLLPVGADLEHGVDVRILAATNRPLEQLVEEGKFRLDLYQRLNVFQIRIPPLRERPEDVEPQVRHFLKTWAAPGRPPITAIAPRVLEALRLLPWEGNTRQLESLIRTAVAHKAAGDVLEMEDLPAWALEELASRHLPLPEPDLLDEVTRRAAEQGFTLAQAVDEFERRLLERVLKQTGGNRTRAATLLGLTPRTIYNKLHKYRLEEQ